MQENTQNLTETKNNSIPGSAKFVAVNYITCEDKYRSRFEELFGSRKHAIDKMPGFIEMKVLRPKEGNVYLIVSHWENEESFKSWTTSEAFIEGHRRGFEDIRKYKEKGENPPMKSDFKTYEVIAN